MNYKSKKTFHNKAKRQDYRLSLQQFNSLPSPSRTPVPPEARGVERSAQGGAQGLRAARGGGAAAGASGGGGCGQR